MKFADKVVWITGASSGIGEALAKEFSRRGARIILSSRRESELERVAATLAGPSVILPFDATQLDDIPQITRRAWDESGGIDMLINNAGVTHRSLALDTEPKVYRQFLEVNALAPIYLTQAILPLMVARRSGHLVYVGTLAAKVPLPLRSGYCASKSAAIGYYDSLRAEITNYYGIEVSVVLPGSTQTALAHNALTGDGSKHGLSDPNLESGISPEQLAFEVADGLAAGKTEIVVVEGKELEIYREFQRDPARVRAMFMEMGEALARDRETNGARKSMSAPLHQWTTDN